MADVRLFMDKETIAVSGRVIERLLVCLTASGAIIMGWNLFRVGIVDPQSGELKGEGWSVKLQKCGPGIFFSLFGTCVLLASFMYPLKIGPAAAPEDKAKPAAVPEDKAKSDEAHPQTSFLMYLGDNSSNVIKFTGSLNTILALAKDPQVREGLQPPGRKERLDRAIHNVELYKEGLVSSEFGSDALMWYKTNQPLFGSNPQAVPNLERPKYEAIRTILDEPLAN